MPWQLVPKEMCVIGQHTVSDCLLHGLYAAKFLSKLIVFGSAVYDDITNHTASGSF